MFSAVAQQLLKVEKPTPSELFLENSRLWENSPAGIPG